MSLVFLLFVPMCVTGFVCALADPDGTAPPGRYSKTALWVMAAALTFGTIVFREGLLCWLMLAPIWLLFGQLGAYLTRRLREKWGDRTQVYAAGVLVLPLLLLAVEPASPAWRTHAVTRSIDIAARVDHIWPLLVALPDIRRDEGRWNISQSLIGIPRPVSAVVVGRGPGAVRHAQWEQDVRFDEHVIEWRPGHALGWRFAFPEDSVRNRTDRHLAPDGETLRIDTGRYTLTPLANGHTRLTLSTNYRSRTALDLYARLWGELLLGDIQKNILAIVARRAELATSRQ